jgi:hypothetical protein
MTGGYIKLWRKMLDSEVMRDDWLCRLWIWCLLKASWQSKGSDLERGQFTTCRAWAAEELKVSQSKWLRGMARLEQIGCIGMCASPSRKKRTTVTVCNYETYQSKEADDEQVVTQVADKSRTSRAFTPLVYEEIEEGKKGAPTAEAPPTKPPGYDPLSVPIPAALESPQFRSLWSEWIDDRRKRRLSTREVAIKRQLKFLASLGHEAALVSLDEALRGGWQGLFKPKGFNPQAGLYDGIKAFVAEEVFDDKA